MSDIFYIFTLCTVFGLFECMAAGNKGTLHGVKTKRWLSCEKCCSFETNFKI